jgi:hypothetical protein
VDEETIDIIIHPNGRVEVRVEGVKGEECTALTKALEEALGNKVDRELTPEYFEAVVKEIRKQGTGH